MKAVIYARYSSDKQTEDSIEAQRHACEEYARKHGLVIVGEYVDEAISGKGSKTGKRVQYQRMLRDANKGLFDTILIHKYDRVARSLAEHVRLESTLQPLGVSLVAVAQDFGQTSESKIMRGLMWILSEYYNDNLADETRKGLKETALKGLHTGGVAPFGYDIVEQKYVINELEAGYVRRLFEAAANCEGYIKILQEMEQAGIKGKRGKTIKYTQVYEMLRNEKYTGTYIYSTKQEGKRGDRRSKPNAIKIENALPIIIDKALFERVQKIMDSNKQVGKKNSYLCSGLVYCSCGAKMHGRTSKRGEYSTSYYTCSAKCGAPSVTTEKVDDTARDYLKELLSKENQKEIAASLRKYDKETNEGAEIFKAATDAKIEEKQKQYDALLANLSTGKLPGTVVQDIGNEMELLKAEMEALSKAEPPKDYTVDTVGAWLDSIKAAPDDKVIHLLVERIDVDNSGQKETTEVHVTSTLTSVVGNSGCGDKI